MLISDRKRLQLVLLATLFAANVCAQDSTLAVLSLNTEWLWTPHDGSVDGEVVRVREPTADEYLAELTFYRNLIQRARVQVVALSEIENAQVAHDLAKLLGAPWQAYFKQGRDTATGQDVALLSSLPVQQSSVTHFNFPAGRIPGDKRQKRLSKILGIRVVLDQNAPPKKARFVDIITTHLLSKRNDNARKSKDRLRQGHALLQVLASSSGPVVLMGDLNDVLYSPVLTLLIEQGNLLSVLNRCRDHPASPEHTIDHILYRGLQCQRSRMIPMSPYSDHPAAYAEFQY